uniref:Uncharacterized LOC104266283 n=1 Tax=Ciona intestinalis TaxID=7719 RepID=H2XRS5_CIOIN|nr:uncharacterized protein LOC104266283 [Ciona intestinalis]|eukprot:XP_009860392.1 uncharacterized protein LOC104266283 [Ciona intestinalis]
MEKCEYEAKLMQDGVVVEKVKEEAKDKAESNVSCYLQGGLGVLAWILMLYQVFGLPVYKCDIGRCWMNHSCEVMLFIITIAHCCAMQKQLYWVIVDILRVLQIGCLVYLKNVILSSKYDYTKPMPLFFSFAITTGIIFGACSASRPGPNKRVNIISGLFLSSMIITCMAVDLCLMTESKWKSSDYAALLILPTFVFILDLVILTYWKKLTFSGPLIITFGSIPIFYLTLPFIHTNIALQVSIVGCAALSYLVVCLTMKPNSANTKPKIVSV